MTTLSNPIDRRGMIARLTVGTVAAALLLSGCTAPEPVETPVARKALSLSIGVLLPTTGALAPFGPAAEAGVALALQDINDAELGISVTAEAQDSGDASTDTGVASATTLIDAGVSAIVGPLSDGVAKKVIDPIIAAGIVQISPGNVSSDFTRYTDDNLYWRTSPACTLEGNAIGAEAAADGAQTLGIIYQLNFCQPGLPEAVVAGFGSGGGTVLAETSFDGTAANLDAQVAEVVAEKPDAVVVITETANGLIVPGLAAAGYAGSDIYFAGLSIADHSTDLPVGSITGSKATMPGIDISTLGDFTDRILELNPAITDFSYAAESYDAVILAALAALAAGDVSGAAIASKLQEVSGGSGDGTKATDFETAAQLILDGETVDYDGPSGEITFDDNGDPTGAPIGIYEYGADNVFTRLN